MLVLYVLISFIIFFWILGKFFFKKKLDVKLINTVTNIVRISGTAEQKKEFLKLCSQDKAFTHKEGRYNNYMMPTFAVRKIIDSIVNKIK